VGLALALGGDGVMVLGLLRKGECWRPAFRGLSIALFTGCIAWMFTLAFHATLGWWI
jgi:hypothetical protein